MTPERTPSMPVLAFQVAQVEKDLNLLGGKVHDQEMQAGTLRDQIAVHTEQITGEGGLQKAVARLHVEMRSLRNAFYGLTAALIAGSLALIGAILSHAL